MVGIPIALLGLVAVLLLKELPLRTNDPPTLHPETTPELPAARTPS